MAHEKIHASAPALLLRLFKSLGRLAPVMGASIFFGVLGHLSAIAMMVGGAAYLAACAGSDIGIEISTLFWIVVIAGACRGVLHFAEQYLGHDVAFRLLAILRKRLFDAVTPLAPAKTVGKRSGDLAFSAASDIEHIEIFFAHTIAPVVIAFLVSGVMLVFLARIHPLFAAATAVFYVIVGILMPIWGSKIQRTAGRRHRKLLASVNASLVETFQGLREIILFGRASECREQLSERGNELAVSQQKNAMSASRVRVVSDVAVISASLCSLLIGYALWSKGELTASTFLIAAVAVTSSFGPVLALSALAAPLSQTLAAAERLFALEDERPQVVDAQDTRPAASRSDAPALELSNIRFSYNEGEPVLKDFSLRVEQGAKIAVVGESGCGKTTVLRLLLRFWDAKEGTVRLWGRDVRELSQTSLRDKIAMVSQTSYLFDASVRENIAMGNPDADASEIEKAARAAELHELLSGLPNGCDTSVGELGGRFSGGERQRIAIARAVLKDAPIVLLDEATANLDTLSERAIQQTLKSVFADKTVITVAHRLSTVIGADVIYVMKKGRIVESGAHEALLAENGVYAALYDKQRISR